MLDRVIRGGTVIDGTGAPRRSADVGIRDGRIAAVGEIDEPAAAEIDARGRIVCPGFVDVHTHYDAQIFWDPDVSPSSDHGVTSVFAGNCGFSVAPLTDTSGEYLMHMLARVEGMPLESLANGADWDWRSFREYLDRFEGRLAIHAGFMVGHSAIRRAVMGEAAVGEKADPSQLRAMEQLLDESLAAGGMGFSSTWSPTHNDAAGKPVPSRWADRDELIALCRVVGRHPGTTLEFIPGVGVFDESERSLMTEMSLAAGRPLNWNVLVVQSFTEENWRAQLAASDYAAERGARVVALTPAQVMSLRLNFRSGFLLDAFPGWPEIIALPHEEKKKALADPAVRKRMDEGANSDEAGVLRAMAQWSNMTIAETFVDAHAGLAGRNIGEIAAERGAAPFDCLLDLALEEDLALSVMPFIPGDDDASWEMRAEAWRDPRTIVGASDAGAHLDMINTFSYSTALLGAGVRERELLGLEEAVRELTDVPARLYGLRERGRIAEGWHADLTVFDPNRVGHGDLYTRHDLPGGAGRLYADASGIDHVVVAGEPIIEGGERTGARPGRVIRSGRDTDTVAVPGPRGATSDA